MPISTCRLIIDINGISSAKGAHSCKSGRHPSIDHVSRMLPPTCNSLNQTFAAGCSTTASGFHLRLNRRGRDPFSPAHQSRAWRAQGPASRHYHTLQKGSHLVTSLKPSRCDLLARMPRLPIIGSRCEIGQEQKSTGVAALLPVRWNTTSFQGRRVRVYRRVEDAASQPPGRMWERHQKLPLHHPTNNNPTSLNGCPLGVS